MNSSAKPPGSGRRKAQLERTLGRWRTAALTSLGIVGFSGFMIYQCFRSDALHWMWYVFGGFGVVLYSVRFVAQVVEYRKTKRAIDELERTEPR